MQYIKICILGCIGMICFPLMISAQSWNIQIHQDIQLNNQNTQDIYDIGIYYCDEGIIGKTINSKMTINMRPGATKNVCIAFYNKSPNTHDLLVGFYAWLLDTKTNIITCDANSDRHRLIDFTDNVINVPGNGGMTTTHAKIRMPKTASGNMYWCLGFTLSWWYTQKEWNMLGIIFARRFPIVVHATWSIYYFGRRDELKGIYVNKKSGFLKWIIWISIICIIYTIFSISRKKTPSKEKK